jgi:hypothetical protein
VHLQHPQVFREPRVVRHRAERRRLDALGDVVFCGRVGSSRALDYAVVDQALINQVLNGGGARQPAELDRAALSHARARTAIGYAPTGACLQQIF